MSELRGRALALAALEHIEKHPEEWRQEDWRCGSACCFAGHAARLAGCTWVFSGAEVDADDGWSHHGAWARQQMMVDAAGAEASGQVHAMDALGLSRDRRALFTDHPLFEPDNTLSDLRRLVDEYLPEGAP